MKLKAFLILIILFIFTNPGYGLDKSELSLDKTEYNGTVISISDGDTITILTENTKEQLKIRLYGIDCPERKQDFGTVAKKFVSDQVFKKSVNVVMLDIDRYDRIVGLVYYEPAKLLNEEILKAGYAWVYDRYCKETFCADWKQLEAQHQAAGTGLWTHKNPVEPWNFRKKK